MQPKKVVIVGGGAGGLELAARLCRKHNLSIEITLVDKQLKHIWKPLYHEVAAGTLDNFYDEIDYISYSYEKGFKFVAGTLKEINRLEKFIVVESLFKDQATLINSTQKVYYDILILALGSETNDFNIPGVKDHCLFLDNLWQAESLNDNLLKKIILYTEYNNPELLSIVIVGGGATGVELAAELNYTLRQALKYHTLTNLSSTVFRITLVEAGTRILGMLPTRISHTVTHYLESNHIEVLTNTKIVKVTSKDLTTSVGKVIPSALTIWAAGIKCNTNSIKHDLEVNEVEQFIVKSTLQTTLDDNIFAFGDCASYLQIDTQGKTYSVPPRAQAAHQQALFLVKLIERYVKHQKLPYFHYNDHGSLISLTHHNVVGNLMGKVAKNLYIEGWFARQAYLMLYKKHLFTLKGAKYLIARTLANFFIKKQRPEIKLH